MTKLSLSLEFRAAKMVAAKAAMLQPRAQEQAAEEVEVEEEVVWRHGG